MDGRIVHAIAVVSHLCQPEQSQQHHDDRMSPPLSLSIAADQEPWNLQKPLWSCRSACLRGEPASRLSTGKRRQCLDALLRRILGRDIAEQHVDFLGELLEVTYHLHESDALVQQDPTSVLVLRGLVVTHV